MSKIIQLSLIDSIHGLSSPINSIYPEVQRYNEVFSQLIEAVNEIKEKNELSQELYQTSLTIESAYIKTKDYFNGQVDFYNVLNKTSRDIPNLYSTKIPDKNLDYYRKEVYWEKHMPIVSAQKLLRHIENSMCDWHKTIYFRTQG